ncbi:MAG TPA: YHS domain-containing protein [Thermoplasmata archaeon]|nr:YHS domain-containing protein [Thermoplasmata archaeon]
MTKVKDPVCGMSIESAKAAAQGSYGGKVVYFCSDSCRQTYETAHKPG